MTSQEIGLHIWMLWSAWFVVAIGLLIDGFRLKTQNRQLQELREILRLREHVIIHAFPEPEPGRTVEALRSCARIIVDNQLTPNAASDCLNSYANAVLKLKTAKEKKP
jgi:hypothetical protein